MPPPDALLLDLDGTLYVGDAAVPGAAEALARLRARGVPHRFVTNTTSRSRAMLAARLASLGIAVRASDILTAPGAAAARLRAAGHAVVAPFLPAPALEDLAGLALRGGTAGRAPGPPPTAVLLGDLGRAWSYDLLQEAFEYVRGGAALVTCSRDRVFRAAAGLRLDAGPFVAALEYAAGVEAEVVGKPSGAFYAAARAALAEAGAGPAARVAMVGDDLHGDVHGAQRAGCAGWLVLTGKTTAAQAAAAEPAPDRVLASVAAVPAALDA